LKNFLNLLGVSQNSLARAVNVPPRHINEIVQGKRSLTADTAVRLSQIFGTSEKFWLGLQGDYDVEEARQMVDFASIERLKVG
jgi:addiction module HigA family antidote